MFSKIDHIFSYKRSLNKHKKNETVSRVLSELIKVELNGMELKWNSAARETPEIIYKHMNIK